MKHHSAALHHTTRAWELFRPKSFGLAAISLFWNEQFHSGNLALVSRNYVHSNQEWEWERWKLKLCRPWKCPQGSRRSSTKSPLLIDCKRWSEEIMRDVIWINKYLNISISLNYLWLFCVQVLCMPINTSPFGRLCRPSKLGRCFTTDERKNINTLWSPSRSNGVWAKDSHVSTDAADNNLLIRAICSTMR